MNSLLHEPPPQPAPAAPQPGPAAPPGLADSELIRRFAQARDESAFAQLVARHGALVMSIARRVLRQVEDQEDVFQATFLALAREADRVPWRSSLAGWLYTVAYRSALRVRGQRAARHESPLEDPAMIPDQQLADVAELDAHERLFDELGKLPTVYRDAILLCCLEGQDRSSAAGQLGCSEMVLKGRLQRGRQLLLRRLGLHGLAVAAVLTTAHQAVQAAQLSVTPELVAATTHSATLWALGQAPLSALICNPTAYPQRGWMTMFHTTTFKMLALGVCSLAILCGGLSLATGVAFAHVLTVDDELPTAEAPVIVGELPDLELPDPAVVAIPVDALADAGGDAKRPEAAPKDVGADVNKALDAPTKLEFTEVPLTVVLDSLKKQHKIAIELDLPGLANEGVDPATPITVNASGISLRNSLRLILDPLGLKPVIKDNKLIITPNVKLKQLQGLPPPKPAAAKTPAQAAADIRQALDTSVQFEFEQTSLLEIAEFLQDYHEIPIMVDRLALDEEGIDAAATPITLNREGISLRAALGLMLDPLKLKAIIKHEVLLITTKTKADQELHARPYRVNEILSQVANGPTLQELADVIRTSIAPGTWAEGKGQVKPLGKVTLVITQTDDVHEEIAQLLKSLQE